MFTIGMTTMTMPSKKQSTLDDITLNDATFTTQQSTMHSVLLPSNDTTMYAVAAYDFNNASLDDASENDTASTTAAMTDVSFDNAVDYDVANYDATTTPATTVPPSTMPPATTPATTPKMQHSTTLPSMLLH